LARRARRNDFTESDDNHLIEFIAQVKPEMPGRLGNNLYLLLEESVRLGFFATIERQAERFRVYRQTKDHGLNDIHGNHGANGTKRTSVGSTIRSRSIKRNARSVKLLLLLTSKY